MNAATAVHTKEEAARPGVLLLEIPLDKISESKRNPRTQFDEKKLAELADDIKQHGVLEPVLVRPLTNGKAGTYELVFGARRYRASKLAKRETIPATVRELTDAECLELQLVENVQRADTHELDEGQGYADLLSLQPSNTVETIAAKVAKSPAYVSGLCFPEHNPFYVVLRFMWSPELGAPKVGLSVLQGPHKFGLLDRPQEVH
jgi:ParB/RepB/Spo0J family partition protein